MRKSLISLLGPTDPVHDLTTVEAVNAALGLDSNTADDAITAEQITTASRLIADQCNAGPDRLRTFGLLQLEENFRVQWGEPVHALYLRHFPVVQVTSLTQADSEADATLYEIDDEAGLLWMKCGRWCGELVINYSAGYDLPTEAPPILAQACIELIGAQRLLATTAAVDPNLREVQHGDTRVVYQTSAFGGSGVGASSSVPSSVMSMIDKYIRRTV